MLSVCHRLKLHQARVQMCFLSVQFLAQIFCIEKSVVVQQELFFFTLFACFVKVAG